MTLLGLRFALAALVTVSSAVADPAKASFVLTIDAVTKSVNAGSEFWVDITLTNASDHKIVVVKSGPRAELSGNRVVVHGTDGRVPPYTRRGRATLGDEGTLGGTSDIVGLQPGESCKEQAQLSGLFELAPDIYTVSVERKDRDTGGVARSNSITIAVTGERKSASFGLVVNSDKRAYTSGADIPIDIILTNNLDHALRLADAGANAELGGSFIVVRGTGARPPHKTRDGWMRLESPSGNAAERPKIVIVQPGATLRERVFLNRLFDLPPDTYQVSVERRDQETGIVSQSSTISITVT